MAAWATAVRPEKIPQVWPACVEHAADALKYSHGEMEIEDVYRNLLTGIWTLWVVVDDKKVVASGTTEVVAYPRMRALRAVTLGGKGMGKWLRILDEAWTDHARQIGCSRIEAVGRPGWTKATKPLGYTEGTRMIIKDLDHG